MILQLPQPALQNLALLLTHQCGNEDLEETAALPCSLQYYLQKPQCRNNLNVHRGTDKENGAQISNGILSSFKKDEDLLICNPMDETRGHYAK